MKKALGIFLIALPFVGIVIFICLTLVWAIEKNTEAIQDQTELISRLQMRFGVFKL